MRPKLRKSAIMQRFTATLALAAIACCVSPPTVANTNTQFTAAVTARCILFADVAGTLGTSADNTQLDSQLPGGSTGRIHVLAIGRNFEISLEDPPNFRSAPTGGNADVTFSSEYDLRWATNGTNIPGTVSTPLNFGFTRIDVDMNATKNSGVFPAGAYTTEVIVRCE